jgi:hypothetical protein
MTQWQHSHYLHAAQPALPPDAAARPQESVLFWHPDAPKCLTDLSVAAQVKRKPFGGFHKSVPTYTQALDTFAILISLSLHILPRPFASLGVQSIQFESLLWIPSIHQ